MLTHAAGKGHPHQDAFFRLVTALRISSVVVVMATQSTAIAMPSDTLPCSNSRLM